MKLLVSGNSACTSMCCFDPKRANNWENWIIGRLDRK